MSTENALLTILVEKINNDTIVLPTLPAIALKVRKAADDPNVNLVAMGDVIGQDPSLSARMIKISNSAFLGRTVKVTSIGQAVTRIGLNQIKNIATALAMEQLFVSKNDLVKEYMSKVWDNTICVVSNSIAAMSIYTARTKNRKLNIDTMTLSALVHNIGVLPILTEAERHQEVFGNTTFLEVAINKLSGRIGGSIMREWGFDDEFSKIAENWNQFEYKTDEISYLDFVRLGAAISDNMGSQKDAVYKACIAKGIIKGVEDLVTDEFEDIRNSAKQVFA